MLRSCSAIAVVILISCPVAADPTVKSGDRVTLMGDSEAFLLAHELPQLARASGAIMTSVTVPGSSVISWSAPASSPYWQKIKRSKPAVIIVSLGANDACMGPHVVANEQPFMDVFNRKIATMGARCVVWFGPPAIGAPNPTKDQCALFLAAPGIELFAQMVQASGFPYLDARTIHVPLWDDHLHCSRESGTGCAIWAAWAWKRMTTGEDLCVAYP